MDSVKTGSVGDNAPLVAELHPTTRAESQLFS